MGCGEYLGHQGACRPDHRETCVLSSPLPPTLLDGRGDPNTARAPPPLTRPPPSPKIRRPQSSVQTYCLNSAPGRSWFPAGRVCLGDRNAWAGPTLRQTPAGGGRGVEQKWGSLREVIMPHWRSSAWNQLFREQQMNSVMIKMPVDAALSPALLP